MRQQRIWYLGRLCVVCSLRHFRLETLEISWSLFLRGRWPRELPRRRRRGVAAPPARAADFVLVELLVGDTGRSLELGRSSCSRLRGRPAWAAGGGAKLGGAGASGASRL